MTTLRSLLLVVVLFFAQWAAGVHALEHALGEREGVPTHACELCLAAHDLGSALPSMVAMLPVQVASAIPENLTTASRASFPAPLASQRAPPSV